ncbi:hypothetical protein MHBO_001074 [Bonamia ostreae]|uniref:Uncharacterized protein n=1 Tax=Bonamia ostreae TaxID=126728 RepID=A0ABV2AHS6_9EUKA
MKLEISKRSEEAWKERFNKLFGFENNSKKLSNNNKNIAKSLIKRKMDRRKTLGVLGNKNFKFEQTEKKQNLSNNFKFDKNANLPNKKFAKNLTANKTLIESMRLKLSEANTKNDLLEKKIFEMGNQIENFEKTKINLENKIEFEKKERMAEIVKAEEKFEAKVGDFKEKMDFLKRKNQNLEEKQFRYF